VKALHAQVAEGAECALFATLNPLKSLWAQNSNPHVAIFVAAALLSHYLLPRFRALALFGRRPPEGVESFVITGGRKPAQKLP
jgi:hypothetical protein